MIKSFEGIVERYVLAGDGFGRVLREVRAEQWGWPTPCAEWDVRLLVNHMTRGNLSYVGLLGGGSAADFLRLRDADALGAEPVAAYIRSFEECAAAFRRPGALERLLDYPLGKVTGAQALAVRSTDSTVHTWDLARAIGADETLDPTLVAWIDDHLDAIYADLAETPTAPETTHRFFAAPAEGLPVTASRQHRLLNRMGRNPARQD
ncbi:TIGR03086 family metal-binding protein [Streptomyces sp. NPDC006733]|uniref:TIGR03086 family metal-binding protein n=1 Tax=Streptomyces sp. NPDC006733 TaxID=3155460 RepID=UPI0033D97418